MTIGTGIFLSALFLGTIGLFLGTKDRWNWKKIFFRTIGLAIIFPVTIGGGIYLWDEYLEDYFDPPRGTFPAHFEPTRIMSYYDIDYGDTKGDVLYKKGKPDSEEIDDDGLTFRYEVKGRVDTVTEAYFVDFDTKDRVVRIQVAGLNLITPKLYGILGIGVGEAELVNLLGEPEEIADHSEKGPVTRIYHYDDKWNLYFHMKKQEVDRFNIIFEYDN